MSVITLWMVSGRSQIDLSSASGPKGLKKIINSGSSVRAAIKAVNIANPVSKPK
jgi:trehalose-6-phosphatase